MSAKLVSTYQAQTPNGRSTPDVNRRSANYSPSIWGDHFLSYASMETASDENEQRVQELKEEVKRMLRMAPTSQELNLIDEIQRLGVSYHFENEIHQMLQKIHNSSYDDQENNDDDELYIIALRFRLLRQQGFEVSCKMFSKFIDVDGKFKRSLVTDVEGILKLYEATHLRTHGEDILEAALAFTTTHLELAVTAAQGGLSPPLLKRVTHALYQPQWKGYPRLEARRYLSFCQELKSSDINETLLTFAKLDFNQLQRVHQKELSDITRWWKELDFVNKLPFARDRAVESYFWALGVYFEPEYCFGRMTLCKIVAIIVVLDDVYDVHGTHEELELFTEAVERWDISALDLLPADYMKICYQALLDIYADIENELAKEGKLYRIHYARESMKVQVRSWFQEAKWFHEKYTPTLDEYMSAALSTTYFMMATTSFVLMGGDIVTKNSLDWVFTDPKMVKASSTIGRLMDDLQSHKFEQKRGHVASAIECYMKEHCATEEEATIELTKQVNNAWKDMNEGWLISAGAANVPRPLLLRIINLARVIEVIYKHEDGFTHAETGLKDIITSLLVEPVPI
ncbi:(-)-germacrene D synthase [Rosa chinensis]|uniref:(-)-germacrene D synthase n=1 Tax=Rosa chinensis TaxID=74649 RepID=UPI000D090D38|nr:(-)-germacrene D synthase [Rosa chinensis]